MLCQSCGQTFEAVEDDAGRVEIVDRTHPFCECQATPVSRFSSGPVADHEVLVRILVSPIHIKGEKVKGAAFSGAEKGGLSLFRNAEATDEEIHRAAKGLVEKARERNGNEAGVLGVLMIAASTIRETQSEGDDRPAFCVYDTALEDVPSHAEAFQRTHNAPDDLRTLRRAELQKNAQHTFVPTAQFRNGLLMDLAPAAHGK